MSMELILGYARSILDSYGLTTVIQVSVIVSISVYVYKRFFGNRD